MEVGPWEKAVASGVCLHPVSTCGVPAAVLGSGGEQRQLAKGPRLPQVHSLIAEASKVPRMTVARRDGVGEGDLEPQRGKEEFTEALAKQMSLARGRAL